MLRGLRITLVSLICIAGAVVLSAQVSAAASHATLSSFAGQWIGHTRQLVISKSGFGTENVDAGCCDRVITFTFQLSDVQGSGSNATASERLVSIKQIDRNDFSSQFPAPRVGEVKRMRLRDDVITDGLLGKGTTYCGPKPEARGVCGA